MKAEAMTWSAVFDKLLDPYEVKARLFPGLLVLLPVIVFIILLYGSTSPTVAGLGSVLATCGGPYLLSNFVRTWGQHAQDRLFREWGGQPSTIMLRHRDSTLPPQTKLRYHKLAVTQLGVIMPSAGEEQENHAYADQCYAAAGDALRPLTNDRKVFPFVFKELVAYGFNRNVYGSRRVGLCIAVTVVFVTLQHAGALSLLSPFCDISRIDNPHAFVLAVSGGLALLWGMHFTAETVRLSSVSYSRRLWEALDKLPKKPSRKARPIQEGE